jgi:hypothetical protein
VGLSIINEEESPKRLYNETVLLGVQENGLYVYRPTSHSAAYLAGNKAATRKT